MRVTKAPPNAAVTAASSATGMSVVPAQTTATAPQGTRVGPGAGAWNVREIGSGGPVGGGPARVRGRFRREARHQPRLPHPDQTLDQGPDLLRRLALAEDRLRDAHSQRALPVELREVAYLLHGKRARLRP